MTDDGWNEEAWERERARVEKAASRRPRDPESPATPKAEGPSNDEKPVGGFAFFLSLAVLIPTGMLTIILSLTTWGPQSAQPAALFALSAGTGALFANIFVRGPLSVLIHELKHSLWSGFVGNKWKGLKVNQGSGHFEYSYTKQTSHFNAFIALAPYILPLFTFVGALVAFALFRHQHPIAVCVVGAAYGVDLLLNTRDISPIQSDIYLIRGGYYVGLSYIAAWNLSLLGLLLAWVFNGVPGLVSLLEAFSTLFVWLHLYLAQRL